jgi:hypothetical protein
MKKIEKDIKVKKLPLKNDEKVSIDLSMEQFLQKTIDIADKNIEEKKKKAKKEK